MALYYNTERFTEILKDLNSQLASGNLSKDNALEYIKQRHGIEKDDWRNAASEARKHQERYYEIKEKNRYIPLASANRHIPAHLRHREKSTFWNIAEAPEMMVKSAIRGTVEGGLQLAPMLLPSVIPSNVKNQIVEDIKEGYRDVDDYLAENSFGVWDYLKKTFDPETNTAEEMGGLLLSLGFGTAGATKGLTKIGEYIPGMARLPEVLGKTGIPLVTKLPGVAKRTSAFVLADLLVTDKDENIARGLIQSYPETFEFLERLAIDENDTDAEKMLKKIIETSVLGVSMEAVAPLIGRAIVGYKKYRAKARAKKDDLLKTPEGHSGNIVETEIVGNLDDGFEHKIRLSQPLFNAEGKPLYVSDRELAEAAKIVRLETAIAKEKNASKKVRLTERLNKLTKKREMRTEKGAKQPGFWGQWFGSRQGLDRLTHQTLERKINRAIEAEAQIRNQSRSFIDTLERSYGKTINVKGDPHRRFAPRKLKDFTDDEIEVLNVALGIPLKTPKGFAIPDDIQRIMNKAKPTKREQEMLQEFEGAKAEYLRNLGIKSEDDLLELQAAEIERIASEKQQKAFLSLPKEVQGEIRTMRQMVDNYTKTIIDEGIPRGGMSGRLDSNLGFYISTDYEIFSNPQWLKAVKKALDKEGKIIGKGKANDVEALEALRGVRQWYRDFKKTDEFGNPLTEHAINRDIHKWIDKIEDGDLSFLQMMVPGVGKPVTEHTLGKILTEKQDIHQAWKRLLREVTDPAERFRSTIRKQARLLAEDEFAKGIRAIAESPYGRNLYRVESPAGKEVPFNFITPLEETANAYLRTAGHNPLAKVFTTPEYKKVLDRVLKSERGPEGGLRYLYAANALAAGSKTIMSHPTHLINIQGNLVFSLANGNIVPLAFPRHFGKIVGERGQHMSDMVGAMVGKNPQMGELFSVSKGKVKVNRQAYEELQALGLLDSGVNQEYFLRAFDQFSDAMVSGKGLSNYLGRAYKGVGRIYRAEDGIFKAYNYYAEMAKYRKAFPNMPIDELKKYASEVVKDTLPTYGRIPIAIKATRKYGLATAFPSFLTESIRVGKNTAIRGVKDVTLGFKTGNVQLIRIGAERLAGLTGAAILGDEFFLNGMIRNGITPDTNNYAKRISAEYEKHAQRYWIGPLQENPQNRGNIEAPFMNMSRTDPYGATKQIAYSLTNHILPTISKGITGDITWDEAKDEAITFIKELAVVGQPILTPSLLMQGAFDVATGKRRKAPHVSWWKEGTENI